MIKFIQQQSPIILLVACMFAFHLFSKNPTKPYERPITGDAQAYYAYLPALFIYQDFDYSFMQNYAAQYYPKGSLKDFLVKVDGETVNKTFPGVTVLYAPFFFLAHSAALVFGKPADGFSSIYQICFDIGYWVYLFFGLVFMRKLLEKVQFSSKIALFCVFFIAFGTNLFFYSVYDQSVTHVHNFFMINALLLSLFKFKEDAKSKWLMLSVGLLVLIGITRPTNFLAFGLIVFFFPSLDFYKAIFKRLFSHEIWKFVLVAAPILALPFIFWKIQTGHWIVYSYGEEGFNFIEPHFFEFLFSYTKGWFTYTPLALFVLTGGLILLFKLDTKKFGIALSFYLISVFIFSSWWCWYYGAGMSQRVMIDHYVLLAFLLALILKFVIEKGVIKYVTLGIFGMLTFFNIAQAYQIRYGILKNGSATEEQYWDNFLKFQQEAQVYVLDHWEEVETINFGKMSPIKGVVKYTSGFDWTTAVNENQTYSATSGDAISSLKLGSKVILSFEAKAETEVDQTRVVLVLNPESDPSTEIAFPYYLSGYAIKDEWTKMEFLFEPTEYYSDSVKIFFWNGDSKEKVTFRNVRYRSYFSNEYR
jgi:hypothetical protein